MSIITIGIDLAKNIFAVHGVNENGKAELVKPKVARDQLLPLIANLPPCLIGMEACSGAHHWARLFRQHGHTVKLMAPKFVTPYRMGGKRGKNDAADAAAICEAVTRPKMRFVPIKEEHQQIILCLHRTRQGFVGAVMMTLVPHDEPLQAEILVKNEDVGFVYPNQKTRIKLAAYPFQKYGMIEGTVIHVGADASDGARPATDQGKDQKAAPQLTYKALVRLGAQSLEIEGKKLRLSPGMQVVAEIHQGRRTVMEYLLSPVQKAFHEAGRER